MRTPTCHPDRAFCARDKCRPCYERDRRALHPGRPRVRTPEQRERRNAADRARAKLARGPGERFPVAPLLAFAAGRGNPPLTAEEMSFRVGVTVPDELTDVEADHIAVALGHLPGDIWPEWYVFDGPHVLPSEDYFGIAICQCYACVLADSPEFEAAVQATRDALQAEVNELVHGPSHIARPV